MALLNDVRWKTDQGTTFRKILNFSSVESGLPANLTGCLFSGSIWDKLSSPSPLAKFTFSIADPATGRVLVSLPASVSLGLPVNGTLSTSTTKFQITIYITDSQGIRECAVKGILEVSPGGKV